VARGAGAGHELFCSTDVLGRESFIVIADETPKRSQRTGGSSLTPAQPLRDKQMRVLTGRMKCDSPRQLNARSWGEAKTWVGARSRVVKPMMGR
jgi:hypothetical protein